MDTLKKTQIMFIFVLMVFLPPQALMAASYITDSFEVTLRTGPSTQNKIIAMISSGQPVRVLEVKGEWSYVRIMKESGSEKEGWMLNRYLIDRMPWKDQATDLVAKNSELMKKIPVLEKQLKEAIHREQLLDKKLQETSNDLMRLQDEHDALRTESADYIALKKEYETVRDLQQNAQQDLQVATEENKMLRSSERNKWFLTGALVLLIGLIIGITVGKKQKKYRSSFSL